MKKFKLQYGVARIEIPNSVIGAVAETLGAYYYSHSRLNTLFMEAGAPGDPPEGGNCVARCTGWMRHCNDDPTVDPMSVLGAVLQEFMDKDFSTSWSNGDSAKGQERIRRALARNGLAYLTNGVVLQAGSSPAVRTLAEMLKARDLTAVDNEFNRAAATVEADPAAALTAACALLESLFKTYIEEEHLEMPDKETIKDLWRPVRDHLGFDPASVADDDVKRILGGLASAVDGVGSFRSHAGSAHGRRPTDRPVLPREARLSINAAHTVAVFVLESWSKH